MVLVCDESLRDLESFRRRSHFKAAPRRPRGGLAAPRRRRGRRWSWRSRPGTEVLVERDGARYDLVSRRPAGRAWPVAAPAGAATSASPAPPTRRPGSPSAGSRARRRGWSCGSSCSPTSGSSDCPTPASPRCWRGSTRAHPKVAGYPFTTLSPVLGTLQTDTPPARAGRHPRAHRGRQRRRRPRPRVPRPRRAHPPAGARAGPQPARRLRSGGQPCHRRARAGRATIRGSPRCRGSSPCPRPTWSTRDGRRGGARGLAGAAG